MTSRAQRHQSLAELLGELGAKVTETTELLEGALPARVPSDEMAEAETPPTPAADHGGHEGLHQHWLCKPEAAGVVARPPDYSETRECENCGKQKPIEEMETVFARGLGGTYQCIDCRGGP